MSATDEVTKDKSAADEDAGGKSAADGGAKRRSAANGGAKSKSAAGRGAKGKKAVTRWDKAGVIFQAITAIAVPVSVIALWLSVNQFKSQQKQTAEQVSNQQRQSVMDDYLNDISSLVLNYNLTKGPQAAVKALAAARTDTAVRNLDGARKGILIRYLWEAGLIREPKPTVLLRRVNLNWAFFKNAYLYRADLSTDYLFRADLSGADLHGANLSWADLIRADLYKANLSCIATSQFAVQVGTFMVAPPKGIYCADLKGANLSDANLADADLVGANLTHAVLNGANLEGASYNSHQIVISRAGEKSLIIQATQWPHGVNLEKANCIDCQKAEPGQ